MLFKVKDLIGILSCFSKFLIEYILIHLFFFIIGIWFVNACRVIVGVDLKDPVAILIALFWIISSFFNSVWFVAPYIVIPYSIIGFMYIL